MSTLLFCVSLTWCMDVDAPPKWANRCKQVISFLYDSSITSDTGSYNTHYMGEFWHHFMDQDRRLIDGKIRDFGKPMAPNKIRDYNERPPKCGYFLEGWVINHRLMKKRKVVCEILGKITHNRLNIFHRNCKLEERWKIINSLLAFQLQRHRDFPFYKEQIKKYYNTYSTQYSMQIKTSEEGLLFWDQQFGVFIFLSITPTIKPSISRTHRRRY